MISAELPTNTSSANAARYLWVLDAVDLPHAFEHCKWSRGLRSGRLKHSNLTAGGPAYSGGELWFMDANTIIINFCSGRYGAEDQGTIRTIVDALRHDGYRVATTGIDAESGYASSRILIGAPKFEDGLYG